MALIVKHGVTCDCCPPYKEVEKITENVNVVQAISKGERVIPVEIHDKLKEQFKDQLHDINKGNHMQKEFKVKLPQSGVFNPKKDITAYELAKIVKFLTNGKAFQLSDRGLHDDIAKHFDLFNH